MEKRRPTLRGPLVRLAAILVPAGALAALPMAWVEQGPVLCLFRRLADVECLGCGMTRAMAALLHGEWQAAAGLNVLALPLAAVLGAVVAGDAVRLVRRLGRRRGE
jgi:hypothetical protein